VIAEKYEAIVSLGMTNSHLKDYFDLWFLAAYAKTDEAILRQAIRATFARRRTEVPTVRPLGLSDALQRVRSNSSSGAPVSPKANLPR
jgi:hypothetical protein